MYNSREASLQTKRRLYALLQRYQPIARSDLATISGLTRAAVSNIVKEFINIGLVEETDKAGTGIGRKKVLLRIREEAINLIGVDLGRKEIVARVYNAGGKVLKSEKLSFTMVRSLHENVMDTKKLLKNLLSWAQVEGITIDAVGIGVPGPVDTEKGIVHSAPHFKGSETIKIKELVEKDFAIPTFVERDVNAAALGEHWFGEGRHNNSFIYLLVVEGIGAGIIINEQLYRGAHELAGKVGRFVFPAADDNEKLCMLEEFGSEISALNIAEDSARKREKGWLYSVLLKRSLGISDLIEGYRRKDTSAIKAVETMTYYAAITVSNLVLLMDPELIIIGGDFVKVHSGFVKDVHTRIKKILEGRPLPELKASSIHDISISLGAATRALSEIITQKKHPNT
ncbi:MAG: ROK family protein [Kosmotoga sp.]|uniref:ROK family transcriptional regulator n=1 Tax=Kosmotoga sp. TaxID=1955248 RepID=UPI001D3530A0|nr:ROK family protein [Kosmotoga sp.]MBO8165781.1 ROK family protein [Kosmotoga sp.]